MAVCESYLGPSECKSGKSGEITGRTQKFKENVDPLIGGTDIIIFAFGADLTSVEDYSGEKFEYLKGQGITIIAMWIPVSTSSDPQQLFPPGKEKSGWIQNVL